MRKITTLVPTFVFAMIFILSGCTKTGPQGPTGPAGPALTGTLEGYVATLDQYGFRVTGDQSGVVVKIDDAAGDSVMTDITGKYTFSNLSTGSYNLTYSKANYGVFKAIDFGFVGGGTTLRNASISQFPVFTLSNITDTIETVSGTVGVLIRGAATADATARSFAVFVGTSPVVSPNPANFTFANTGGTVKAAFSTWSQFISTREFYDAGLNSGTTVYLAIYPLASGSTSYTDLATGKPVYTALSPNPSQVLTVVIP